MLGLTELQLAELRTLANVLGFIVVLLRSKKREFYDTTSRIRKRRQRRPREKKRGIVQRRQPRRLPLHLVLNPKLRQVRAQDLLSDCRDVGPPTDRLQLEPLPDGIGEVHPPLGRLL